MSNQQTTPLIQYIMAVVMPLYVQAMQLKIHKKYRLAFPYLEALIMTLPPEDIQDLEEQSQKMINHSESYNVIKARPGIVQDRRQNNKARYDYEQKTGKQIFDDTLKAVNKILNGDKGYFTLMRESKELIPISTMKQINKAPDKQNYQPNLRSDLE